jgi:hypothetical protein
MSRAELYQRLLKTAAKQLGCKPSDERAKDLAVLRLCRESITSKLISGRDVDPSALRWLVEELAKFSPPPAPLTVQVEVVGKDGVPISKLPREPEPEPTRPSPPMPPSCPVPAVSNVVELPRRSGIHDDKEGLSCLKN